MKLKFILPVIIFTLFTGAIFYPITREASITINASMYNVYNQLNNAQSWEKWDTSIKTTRKTHAHRLSNKKGFIISSTAQTTQVTFSDALVFGVNKGRDNYDIILIPQKLDRSTAVVVSYKSNLLSYLLPGQSEHWLKKTSVLDLKNYVENPSSYYGINFKTLVINDIKLMICKKTVHPADLFHELKKIVNKLYRTVPAYQVIPTHKIYVQTIPADKDITLLVGIPVKKELSSIGEINYMPFSGGKVLTANYEGKYSDKQKIYDGIDAYFHDNHKSHVFKPVEVYSDTHLPISDTGHISTELIFPTY